MNTQNVNILGISFTVRNKEETLGKINEILSSTKNSKTVFTPNAEILYKASRDETYKNTLNSASLLIPDGIGINFAFRIMGIKAPDRTTGIDIAEYILLQASKKQLRVFLLGGKRGVVDSAKKKLEAKYKNLYICGTSHGYFDKSPNSKETVEIINKINQSKADILFVCFGAPLQEIWIKQNVNSFLSVKMSMGLGGCLDVWSGNVSRAPRTVRRIGLEWMYRAIRQPKRLKRLPTLAKFLFSVIRQSRKERKKERKVS